MTIEDYQKNLRGVNDRTDFSPEFLVSYHAF
jgi:brefeldin A-resistance guanine nucleotide exchange factor 1